jgi:hypothetical protein
LADHESLVLKLQAEAQGDCSVWGVAASYNASGGWLGVAGEDSTVRLFDTAGRLVHQFDPVGVQEGAAALHAQA